MPTSIVSFGRGRFAQKPETPRDWSNQERAELYRIADLLHRSGLAVGTDSGLSDEGDPWFVFYQPDSGDVIAHFARIDGLFVAAASTAGATLRGRNFRDLIDQIIERQPLVFPRADRQPNNVRKLFLHPAVVLTAFVATALLHSRKALADTGHQSTKDGADTRGIAGGGASPDGAAAANQGGFLFHAAGMASALAMVIASTKADPSLLAELGLSDTLDGETDGSTQAEGTEASISLAHAESANKSQARGDSGSVDATDLSELGEGASPSDDGFGAGHDGATTIAQASSEKEVVEITSAVDPDALPWTPVPETHLFKVAGDLPGHTAVLLSAGLIQEKGGTPAPVEQAPGVAAPMPQVAIKTDTTPVPSPSAQAQKEDTVSTTLSSTQEGEAFSRLALLSLREIQDTDVKQLSVFKVSLSDDGADDGDTTLITSASLDGSDGEDTLTLDAGDTMPTLDPTELTVSPGKAMLSITGETLQLSNDTTEVIYYEGGKVEFLGYQVGVDSILVGGTVDTTSAEMTQARDGSIVLNFGQEGSITLVGVTMADLVAIG